MNKDKIGWFSIAIFWFLIGITALNQKDYVYGIGLLSLSIIFFNNC